MPSDRLGFEIDIAAFVAHGQGDVHVSRAPSCVASRGSPANPLPCLECLGANLDLRAAGIEQEHPGSQDVHGDLRAVAMVINGRDFDGETMVITDRLRIDTQDQIIWQRPRRTPSCVVSAGSPANPLPERIREMRSMISSTRARQLSTTKPMQARSPRYNVRRNCVGVMACCESIREGASAPPESAKVQHSPADRWTILGPAALARCLLRDHARAESGFLDALVD